jgi:hypothetical protein
LTGTQVWRLSLAAILGFGWLFLVPLNAYATCINQLESQTIAAAYEGDAEPTVHHMDTCSGDDIGYQIPIATTITFDGIEYSNVYATTNSVITFGSPDPTYWDYPTTPSISLYSMDWFPGRDETSGLDIYYSEGGFQINLNMVPFGSYGAEPSTVNILVAITNEGGISVAYSYQGPEYQNMRTGVRLHDGSIVSLEAWGATQVSPSSAPTLQAVPVEDVFISPEPTPSEEPMTAEEIQAKVVEAAQLAQEVADLNNLIAAINGEDPVEEISPEPEVTVEPDPEITEEPLPEPDVEVEPEIITPEDPRFPDDTDEQNQQDPATEPEDSEIVDVPSENEEPVTEPESPEEDIDESPVVEPENPEPVADPVEIPDSNPSPNNNTGVGISEEELNKLNKLIASNDAKLLAEITDSQKEEVADVLGVKAEEIILIAELAQSSPAIAKALETFAEKAEENADAPMPYTLADAITEAQTEQFLADPIGALTNIDFEKVFSPSEWGKDMTDDQREKAQEVIIPVIIAGNIIAAAMTRRI